MSSIDDTKRKLNIDELDEDSRNKMFSKFVEKGGKVIREKEKKPDPSKRKNSTVIRSSDSKRKFSAGDGSSYDQRERSGRLSYYDKPDYNTKKIKRYYSVFLAGYFQGVFSLSLEFKNKFSDNMIDELIRIINELSDFLNIFLDTSGEKKWQNVGEINTTHQFGYELLIRIYNLDKRERSENLINYFKTKKQKVICPIIINDIIKLFKELFIIFPYWETTKEIIWQATEIYKYSTKIEPILTKSKIYKNLDRIFSYYLPRLLTIINYNVGKKISYDYNAIENNFNFSVNEIIGYLTKQILKEKKEFLELQKKQKEETLKKIQEEIERKEIEKIPKYIQKGLSIIDNIITNIINEEENDPKFKLLDDKEKMLIFYAIFKEFDNEYSFVLTTSQLKFNPKMESGKRIDIKQDFEELYVRFNEINSFIKEYFDLTDQLVKFKEQVQGQTQYYENNIENINKKRVLSFNEIRSRSTTFFKKYAITLQTIIQDYNNEKRFLQNPEQKLSFQLEKNSNKKFEDVSIVNAILYSFSFVSAIHYLLETGKLSSRGLYFSESGENEDIAEASIESSDAAEDETLSDTKKDTNEDDGIL